MHSVILVLVFWSSPAGAEQRTEMEVIDMATCEQLAARWKAWPGGSLRMISAACITR